MFKRQQKSSSQSEDDQQIVYLNGNYSKFSVSLKIPIQLTTREYALQCLDESKSQPDEDLAHLRPKMPLKTQKENENISNVNCKNKVPLSINDQKCDISRKKDRIKGITSKKRKHDPVSLFQTASSLWKQDKFLISRGNNKEGRKLDLEKRNRKINEA